MKEVIDNLVIDSDNMKFVSRSTPYKENNGVIVVNTSPKMIPTSKQISVNYHWFRHHVLK